jgi:hypothetical protein
MDGDGAPEVLIATNPYVLVVIKQGSDGVWAPTGTFTFIGCTHLIDDLKAGRFSTPPSRWRDLQVGDAHLNMEQIGGSACKSGPAGSKP